MLVLNLKNQVRETDWDLKYQLVDDEFRIIDLLYEGWPNTDWDSYEERLTQLLGAP